MGRILFKGCAVDSELSVCVFSVSLPIFEKDRFKKFLFRLLLWHPQVVESWSTIRSWIIIKLESQVARDHENYHKQNCEMERTTSLAARVLINSCLFIPDVDSAIRIFVKWRWQNLENKEFGRGAIRRIRASAGQPLVRFLLGWLLERIINAKRKLTCNCRVTGQYADYSS